jgi:hypothetical protein
MAYSQSKWVASLKFCTIALAFMFAALAMAFPDVVRSTDWRAEVNQPTPTPVARQQPRRPDFSKFSHNVKEHKAECSSCHAFPSSNWNKVRTGDDAFPDITDYPKHASCVNCHRQQFFRGATPAICSICHTNPSPRNSMRHPFPNPREIFDRSPKGKAASSDFQAYFPHDIHVDMISSNNAPRTGFINASLMKMRKNEESCSVCHQTMMPQGDSDAEYFSEPPKDLGDRYWLKKGTFKTAPIGHTTCFTCHSTDSGIEPAPSNCAACHRPKEPAPAADFDPRLASRIGVSERVMLDAWSTRASSGTFRHEFMSHAEMSCSSCHNVSSIITTDSKTKKVPVTSCNYCHITSTADEGGVLNFEIDERKKDKSFQCVKCHLSFGTLPVPESHLKAITGLAGN